jgi:HK97 family phage portal protein
MSRIRNALNALRGVEKSQELTLQQPMGWDVLSGGPTYTGKNVSIKTLLQMSATWSAIRLISETIGTLPLHLYRRTSEGREKAVDHDLYSLIHTQPNKDMTSVEWREAMAVSLCCWGQAYCESHVLGPRTRRVIGITPLSKPNVTPYQTSTGDIRWRVAKKGYVVEMERGQIIPIKGFGGIESMEGYAPYHMHRESLAIGAAAEEYAARFFENGGHPSALLIGDKWPEKENARRLEGLVSKAVGKLLAIGGGYTYQKVTGTNSEAQLMEMREFQIAEAARIWRVPKSMLMASEGNEKYSNNEQQNLHFLQYTLRPYLVRIEQALNTTLLSRSEQKEYYIEFDVKGLLRGDSRARGEWYRNMRMISGMTINEVREAENLPRIEGGDDIHVPLNMAPLDQLSSILGGNNGDA